MSDLLPSLKEGASSFTGSSWGLPQSDASLHWQKRLARPSLFLNFDNSKEHVVTQRT